MCLVDDASNAGVARNLTFSLSPSREDGADGEKGALASRSLLLIELCRSSLRRFRRRQRLLSQRSDLGRRRGIRPAFLWRRISFKFNS